MNLIKGFDIVSLFKKGKKNPIYQEIEDDFKEYTDLNKIDISIRDAVDNEKQVQFEDMLQMNYVFGEYDKRKNNPLGPFDRRVTINHVPGHIIYSFTSFDKMVGKKENQDNYAKIQISERNSKNTAIPTEEFDTDFSKAGKFIRKFILKYHTKYPELTECKRLNYRGIFDMIHNISPIVGFISGISVDRLDYTYPFRYNENIDELYQQFHHMTRESIEKGIKTRDNGLYQPIWKQQAKDLKKIKKILLKHLKPIEKFCTSMFGDQKYIYENKNIDKQIKITYMVSKLNLFETEVENIIYTLPDFYKFENIYYEGNGITMAILRFKY